MTDDTRIRPVRMKPGSPRTRRRCGNCTACCLVLQVPELGKPRDIACPHAGNGCKDYDHRPASCRSYRCMWLDGFLDQRDKPNRIGIVLDRPDVMVSGEIWSDIPSVMIRVVHPGAKLARRAKEIINTLAERKAVLLARGDDRKLKGPAALVSVVNARMQDELKAADE